jgi:pimeloyl-ACP methyl ester carboxylesterase
MPEFASFDGVTLWFDEVGSGDPVVLLHSYPFDSRVWDYSAVVPGLVAAGRRVIRLDARGRGRSQRPRDPQRYAANAMAHDVSCLLDHLRLQQVDLAGYSLGSNIALGVLQREPRVRAAVLGGVGDAVLHPDRAHWELIAAELEIDDVTSLPPAARENRARIDRLGADRHALAAMWRGPYLELDADLSAVKAAVLILTGVRDDWMGDPALLAQALPNARLETIDADHITAMEHPDFAAHLIAHLTAPARG